MTALPRWAKWTGGCLGALLLMPILLVLWWQWISQPLVTARWRSPDGRWQVRLQRSSFGTIEAKYYDLHALSGWWPFRRECPVGGITGFGAEQYIQIDWPAPDRVLIRYGLSRYDRKQVGVVYVEQPSAGCGSLRAVTRHDPALDAAATRENLYNHDYANPEPPDPLGNDHV